MRSPILSDKKKGDFSAELTNYIEDRKKGDVKDELTNYHTIRKMAKFLC